MTETANDNRRPMSPLGQFLFDQANAANRAAYNKQFNQNCRYALDAVKLADGLAVKFNRISERAIHE